MRVMTLARPIVAFSLLCGIIAPAWAAEEELPAPTPAPTAPAATPSPAKDKAAPSAGKTTKSSAQSNKQSNKTSAAKPSAAKAPPAEAVAPKAQPAPSSRRVVSFPAPPFPVPPFGPGGLPIPPPPPFFARRMVAQAPAPAAPAPAAPPSREEVRAERRERLRALGDQVLGAITAPDGAGDSATLLDMTKLNAGLKPLVVDLLGGAEAVESLRVGFDPEQTDFAADKFRITADAVLRRTAWANAPSRANIALSAHLGRTDSGSPVALIDGTMRLETSTVALTNYAVAQYKAQRAKKLQKQAATAPVPGAAAPGAPSVAADPFAPTPAPAPAPAPANSATAAPAPTEVLPPVGAPSGVAPAAAGAKDVDPGDELFAQLLDERLATVGRLETLDDVADLLTAVSGLRLTAVSQRIEQLREQARTASDPKAKQGFEAQLAKIRADRDRLFDVRPRIERGTDGRAKLIALGMVGSELFPGAEMQQMEMRLTETEVSIAAAGSLTKYVEFYPLAKPLIVNVLVRIQNGDPRALEGVRTIINLLLRSNNR